MDTVTPQREVLIVVRLEDSCRISLLRSAQPTGHIEGVGSCPNLVISQRLARVENVGFGTIDIPKGSLCGSGLGSRNEVDA